MFSAIARFVAWYLSLQMLGPLTPAIIAGFVILISYALTRLVG